MWRRRKVSSYRGETIAEDPEQGIPFDDDSGDARSSQPKSATTVSNLFENRSVVSEPQRLVGYRVVRMLGRGTRATVYLGHRPATPAAPAVLKIDHDGDPLGVSAGEPRQTTPAVVDFDELVALKLFHPATGQDSIDLEVRVLTASSGQHVLGLTDIATTPGGGVVLVLPYLSGGTLAQLLERRGRLLPGEAVNILVPIVTAVTQLYRSGFRHLSLSSTRVMFDARGTPVVSGIGRARAMQAAQGTEAASPAGLGAESEIWESVAALANEVLTRVRPDESNGAWLSLKAGLARHDSASARVQDAERFIAQLFEWADPQAVAQNDPDSQFGSTNRAPSRIPGRTLRAPADRAALGGQAGLAEEAGGGQQPALEPVERSWLGVFHLPTQLRDSVERALDLSPVHMLKSTLRSIRGRTRRMLVAGGLVFALLAAVLLAIPSDSQTADSKQEARGVHGGVVGISAVNAGIPSQPAVAGDSDRIISAGERSTILDSDPLVAVEVLLAARQRCLREQSMVCLLEVVQEKTALMDADRARLRDMRDMRDMVVGHGAASEGAIATEPPLGPQTHTATLVERSGDAALILWEPRVSHEHQPVSVLMMRAETGWRLREIFDY